MPDDKGSAHPDHWGAGLHFRGKALNVKSVTRAVAPGDVLHVCLSHNLRSDNGDHRHRSRIDLSRSGLNEVLRGPSCSRVAAELASSILEALGIRPARRDAIMGIELVFQPPGGADVPAFWSACLQWAEGRYQHVLSAIVHRDQSRPHMHLLAVAVADGRLDGNGLTAGVNRFAMQRRDFLAHMRDVMGLRPDRRVKTLDDLAVSTGKGAKTRAAAIRSDAKLARAVGAKWKPADVGMGVSGHGDSALEKDKPHAQTKRPTPTIAQPSSLEALVSKWGTVAAFQRRSAEPMAPCPKPSQGNAMHAHAPPVAVAELSAKGHAKTTAGPKHPPESYEGMPVWREREGDHEASHWCEELGEFVALPAPPSRGARMAANDWVAEQLARVGGRHA